MLRNDLSTDVEQVCIQVRQTAGVMAREGKDDMKRVAVEREDRGESPLTGTGTMNCLMAAGEDCSQHSLWIAKLRPVSYVEAPEPGAAVTQFVVCI